MPSEVAQHGYFRADLAVMALQKAGKELTVDRFLEALESIMGNGPIQPAKSRFWTSNSIHKPPTLADA